MTPINSTTLPLKECEFICSADIKFELSPFMESNETSSLSVNVAKVEEKGKSNQVIPDGSQNVEST